MAVQDVEVIDDRDAALVVLAPHGIPMLSIWTYLYGPEAASISAASKGEFQRLLDTVAAGFR